MRLRTRLFLTWAGTLLLLWAGAFWSIHAAVKMRIDSMAQDSFVGTKRDLNRMQQQRTALMQQAGSLIMQIPELRSLIAEHGSELSQTNRDNLQSWLHELIDITKVSFVAVVNHDPQAVAQSEQSPWLSTGSLNQYMLNTSQPLALLKLIFGSAEAQNSQRHEGQSGLWSYDGHLYQVVAVPLIFGKSGDEPVEGALIFGDRISDTTAAELGQSHNSQVSFFAGDAMVASSLPASSQTELLSQYQSSHWRLSRPFVLNSNGTIFHASLEPLIDPCSTQMIGAMLIQSNQQDAQVESSLVRTLGAIMIGGLALAAAASFLISAAITHPVQSLVAGVQRVARGDLELTLPVRRRDELGELSGSFNDMVSQLRSRRQLQQQFEQAQTASQAKSQFLANMSHEIRTPLNGVIGMTELLIGTDLTPQQRRYAALVKTSAELLTTQINDILDFSKIEAGKLEIENIDFNVHESVEAIVDLMSEKASKKKLELACHFHPDVPRQVRGDPERLRQVLVNLINNAIKFTPSGSIVVRIAPHADAHGKSLVRFTVIDSGVGIPQDRMDRLFKPFSQVDASTTRKFGGTGLGLAISKQLVELMGGTIGVQSEPNRGSTFWFTVRLERQITDPAPRPMLDASNIRVLAVDDSQTTRGILLEQLESWGLRAETAASAADALGAMRQANSAGQPFNVALIDSDMPQTSGFELARAIKTDTSLSKTVLMALLPIEAQVGLAQLKEGGFAGHVNKPVRQSQLFDSIMKAVAREHATSLKEGARIQNDPSPPSPRGRILVAEDNEVNQIVIAELLTKSGHPCEIVGDGRKAVEQALSGKYDLVLMDCQMPEMDGYEAAEMIRQQEQTGNRRRIPIIALTANAMQGDRAQCLAAGMDGHCAKPVDAKQLLAQIEGFLKKRPAEVMESPVSAIVEPQTGNPPVAVHTLVERCMNNLTTIEIVIQKFEKQAQRDLDQLRKNLEASDLSAATRTAHSLKGAASMVAADGVAGVAAEIERLGKQRQGELMQSQLARLSDEVQKCIEYLPQVKSLASRRLSDQSRSV